MRADRGSPDVPPEAGYVTGSEHLHDHLRRIDQLVRAQTIRWRATLAATKPEKAWGMVLVTDEEVARYLESPFRKPGGLESEVEEALAAEWRRAEETEAAIERRVAATSSGVDLRLERLVRLFHLSELERDAVLLVFLGEHDERYRRLFGYLMDHAARVRPTVGLLLDVLLPAARRAPGGDPVAAGARLFDGRSLLLATPLLTFSAGEEETPLHYRTLRLEERVASFLLGDDRVDARLEPFVEHLPDGADELPQDPEARRDVRRRLEQLGRRLGAHADENGGAVVLLHGRYGSGRRARARSLSRAAGRGLLVLDAARAARRDDFAWLTRLAVREASLLEAALAWGGCEALLESDAPAGRREELLRSCERRRGLSFLVSEHPWDPAGRFRGRLFLRLDVPVPQHEERRRLWEASLPPSESFAEGRVDREALAAALAGSFQLTAGQIRDAVASARGHAFRNRPEDALLTAEDLYEGCRRASSRHLTSLARHVEPRAEIGFEDLVLPPLQSRQVAELRQRIRLRHRVMGDLGFERRLSLGRGLIALFTGSPGTGKTMAAELLAKEQGVDLYKVDTASVVSKWVGETEKNLGRVFDEGEDSNAILFFDEADALFGKRGEVADAHDRYANLEVSYLLQRVEEYSGVVILTTNLMQNIDAAFLRRVHTVIEFPPADAERRFLIWRGMFPRGLRRPADRHLRELAERFRFSGGEIKNVVLDAAFFAAAEAEGEPSVRIRHLVRAVARQYQRSGKMITRGELGDAFFAMVDEPAG